MKRHALARGFTLVELMIAMLITGVVTVVIFALFDSTSDNFLEVDNLADVDDRLRFSMQRIRADFQTAAAQATPDSVSDPWVEPQDPGVHVAGFMPYADWYDNDPANNEVATVNPLAKNDGIVVMGAFDYPLPFEVTGLNRNGDDSGAGGRIDAHYRGLMRLRTADLFQDGLDAETLIDDWDQVSFLQPNWQTRLLRIRDRQGFTQFAAFAAGIEAADFEGAIPADGRDWSALNFELNAANDTLGPKYKIANAADVADGFASSDYGLDEVPEDDVGYDAALIDAYWYHVIQDPTDDKNQQLVRDRLCAGAAAEDYGGDPSGMLASTCGGNNERVIIANNVADFRIWFDCADATGAVNGATWGADWQPPNRGTSCIDTAPPQPGLLRVAHVRLSLHTPTERKNQAHIQFEDATGALCPPDPATGAADVDCAPEDVGIARMRTFDVYPKTVGAARVATLQSDFELTNFTARDIR